MKPNEKIVVTYPFDPVLLRAELGKQTQLVFPKTPAALRKELGDADALITLLSDPVDARLLARAPKLRVIGNYAVGFNNIDLDFCRQRGIRVVNTPKVLTRATAELTLALLLAAARRIPEGEALCRKNRFRGWAPDLLLGLELRGRRAVLVGCGRIGRETGRLFRAIGIQVEWITRRDSEISIRKKLGRAQILSLHVPLTPATVHWLSAERLALLPGDCIVLNTTRGPVVNEGALIAALENRRIFAAGLDVFEKEPKLPSALRRLPNVVLLPHVGSATREARSSMLQAVASGVRAILDGNRPWNEVKFQPTKGR